MMYRATSANATWQIFWYEKNLQGDVVAVYSHDGVKLVSYAYDAWGNTTETRHVNYTAASYNPFRYRGYYYDSDISLYCLGTRWYSTQFRRFLSPDDISYLGANGDLNSYNLYAYCDNNPVMRVDYTGEFWGILFDVASLAFSIVDVCQNPDDVWAWVGLAFDIVDLVPIISCTGEVADVLRFANKSDDTVSEFLQAGGKIRKVRKYEISKSGRTLIRDLYRTSEGYTVSTHRIGTQIHKNFRRNGHIIPNSRLRVDGVSKFWHSIYELKPNNPKSIQRGIQQLYQYRDAYKAIGKNYKMVLVLY